MELWELAARERVRDVIGRYAHLVDGGRLDEVVELFEPDGVLEVEGQEPRRGREAIRALMAAAGERLAAETTQPHIRHHVTSIVVDVDGADRARARSYFLAVTERGVDHWGRYSDELTARDGRWRFIHRRVRVLGRTPGAWAREDA